MDLFIKAPHILVFFFLQKMMSKYLKRSRTTNLVHDISFDVISGTLVTTYHTGSTGKGTWNIEENVNVS